MGATASRPYTYEKPMPILVPVNGRVVRQAHHEWVGVVLMVAMVDVS